MALFITIIACDLTEIILFTGLFTRSTRYIDTDGRNRVFFVPFLLLLLLFFLFSSFFRSFSTLLRTFYLWFLESGFWFLNSEVFHKRSLSFYLSSGNRSRMACLHILLIYLPNIRHELKTRFSFNVNRFLNYFFPIIKFSTLLLHPGLDRRFEIFPKK